MATTSPDNIWTPDTSTVYSIVANLATMAQSIQTALTARTMPTGVVQGFVGTTAPSGWILCRGQAVSRSTYSGLFAVIGTQFGSGDGTTTFNLPDLQGRVPVGYKSSDTHFNIMGKTGGEVTHKLSISEMPAHSHQNLYVDGNLLGWQSNGTTKTSSKYTFAADNSSHTIKTGNTGGSGAHNNLQPYQVMNFIIKT